MRYKFENDTHKGELSLAHPDRLDDEGRAFGIVVVYEKKTRYSWNEEYWERIVNEDVRIRPEDAATYGGWPWRKPYVNHCKCGIELPEGFEKCPECRRKESFVVLHCDSCGKETPHEPQQRGFAKAKAVQRWHRCTVCGTRGPVHTDMAVPASGKLPERDSHGHMLRPEDLVD